MNEWKKILFYENNLKNIKFFYFLNKDFCYRRCEFWGSTKMLDQRKVYLILKDEYNNIRKYLC